MINKRVLYTAAVVIALSGCSSTGDSPANDSVASQAPTESSEPLAADTAAQILFSEVERFAEVSRLLAIDTQRFTQLIDGLSAASSVERGSKELASYRERADKSSKLYRDSVYRLELRLNDVFERTDSANPRYQELRDGADNLSDLAQDAVVLLDDIAARIAEQERLLERYPSKRVLEDIKRQNSRLGSDLNLAVKVLGRVSFEGGRYLSTIN